MTVEQVWEYGQGTRPRLVQPGHVAHPLRSRQGLRHGVLRHGRHGLQPLGRLLDASASCLNEFEWGAKEPAVEIQMSPGSGYRAFPISVKKAFTEN